jgi:predicted PurR-regulated permease PerM
MQGKAASPTKIVHELRSDGRPVQPAGSNLSRAADVASAGRPSSVGGTLAICIAVVGALYFGRDVLVPLALALLLSFILAPGVTSLRRWHVGRVTSVLIMVALAFLVIFTLGAVITTQMTNLGQNLPQYEWTIRGKIHALQETTAGSSIAERAASMLRDLRDEIRDPRPTVLPSGAGPARTSEREPIPVRIQPAPPGPVEIIQSIIGPLIDPLATAGLVIIFAIFILLQREDLRDRLIRLAGTHDLQRTTQAITDAALRVSRYLLAQTVVNAFAGFAIGSGLWLIGVPNSFLWGILVMMLRFVPYIGWLIAAAFPLALSLAIDPGWTMLAWTAAVFVMVELFVGYVVEPWLFGTSLGLSALAIVIAATFWTWLWGPIGLLLSAPLTACLATLGRHVPHLQFLDVVLGDQPVLEPEESFYQRLLAGDPAEAADQAEEYLKRKPLSAYYDEVVIPALALAQSDLRRGSLSAPEQSRLLGAVQEVIDDLDDHPDAVPEPERSLAAKVLPDSMLAEPPADVQLEIPIAPTIETPRLPPDWQNAPVLCIASRTDLDEAAASILSALLAKHGVPAKSVSWQSVSIANLSRLDSAGARMLCISCLDPRLSSHVRFLIRRLRRKFPRTTIIVGFWTLPEAQAIPADRVSEIGADFAARSLSEALTLICRSAAQAIEGAAHVDSRADSVG